MKKKICIVVALVLVVVACFALLCGCDGSSRFVKYVGCSDFTMQQGVNVTMSRRMPKTAAWMWDKESIKYNGSLEELYDLMQVEDGYTKTLYDDYILIETSKDGLLYTWGIFGVSIFGDDYEGEFNYVLTNLGCDITSNGWSMFFFPIYTMERPLLWWKEGRSYKCNITMDELVEFYSQHGYTAEVSGNVLKVSTPLRKYSTGDEYRELWDIIFDGDGTVSVANCLTEHTIYD